MRFAFLSQSWPEYDGSVIYGSSVQVYYVAKELAMRGHQILVILSSDRNESCLSEGNITVLSIPAVGGPPFLIKTAWLKKVQYALKQFKPDVIYQRGKLLETIAAATCAMETKACFLWLSNSDKSPERWKWVKKRWARRREILRLLPRLADALYSDLIIEKALCNANVFVAQNRYQQKTLKKNYGFHAEIIGSGHPIPPFKGKNTLTPKVLWLANLTPVKRPWLFADMAEEFRDTNAEFLMAGMPFQSKTLERILLLSKKSKSFHYLGGVSLTEGNALMKKADIFIITSEYEGLPNTFIQACIHGVPTIILVKDPNSGIRTYNAGVVVETFNEMKDKLSLLLQDAELRKKEGLRAYELAKSEFDIKIIVDRLIEVIQSC
jgi:glycosyltransferase involved in cell wall biosynthesis